LIRIYTKTRHVDSIHKFLNSINLDHEIFTTKNPPSPEHEFESFDLGVSYSYPRKITKELLNIPSKGFINYHAAPLPEYKGWLVYEEAIKNKETHWGVTLHVVDEHYDTGPIIKRVNIELHEPPVTKEQLGSIGHWFMFHLFKQSIMDVYNGNYTTTTQITSAEEIYTKNL
jgi:methionyl-tRNA formyltransferase